MMPYAFKPCHGRKVSITVVVGEAVVFVIVMGAIFVSLNPLVHQS